MSFPYRSLDCNVAAARRHEAGASEATATPPHRVTFNMPRIPTSLIRKARAIDPYLPALLGPCRELQAAQNELRWLREHVDKVAKARRAKGDTIAKASLLQQLVKDRAAGKPLQYLLGTEYFGDLEIRCRPGVLIPRYLELCLLSGSWLTTRTEQTQPLQLHT